MHLLHDDVLPLFTTIKQLESDIESFNVFFLDEWHDFFDYPHLQFSRSLYSRLIPAKSFLAPHSYQSDALVCFRDAFVGLAKESTWYDYGFRQHQGPLPSFPGQESSLKKTLNQATSSLGISSSSCSSRRIVLISRKRNRLIMNERDVVKVISGLVGYEYSVVALRIESFVNFTELVSKVSCAKVMVGMHGSGLALTAFLPPDAGVMELFPYAVKPEDYTPYKRLAQLTSIPYRAWSNTIPENSTPHPDFPASLGGISHLPPDERIRIMQSTQVPRHRCCDNPEWLYRINQDTLVHLPSFTQVFKSLLEDIETSSLENKSVLHLVPGRVSSLECLRFGTDVTIKWIQPWNIQLNGRPYIDFISYEILVQDRNRQETLVYHTNQTIFTVKVEGSQTMIWVRCHIRSLTGPFNYQPVYC
jgi:protein O-mannose beta-1,4-N-acetylglucosaminyltransferase